VVVIFTKRDGAVGKVTRYILDKSETPVSRAFKKEARTEAMIQVDQRVKEREEELRQLSQANSCMAFLTTSGMVSCLNLVEKLTIFRHANTYTSSNSSK